MHKHNVSNVASLIKIKEELNNQLLLADTLSDTINKKEKELTALNRQLLDQANILSQKREEAIMLLSEEVLSIIASLGMPEASFSVKMEKLPMPTSDGIDKIIFLFNANKGGKTDELAKTASGGERSRLMLAVKSILARKKLLPTIVFDEIDSGTSGEIATKTGKILKEMAGKMQVIVITHLPQIAALGNRHFKAIKESAGNKTWSNVIEINNKERILEIAGMLSDGNVSNAAIETAKQLMDN
jgi:DNA repair protein RecN (Recombination protein N)